MPTAISPPSGAGEILHRVPAVLALELGALGLERSRSSALKLARTSASSSDGSLVTKAATAVASGEKKESAPIGPGAASHEAMPWRAPSKESTASRLRLVALGPLLEQQVLHAVEAELGELLAVVGVGVRRHHALQVDGEEAVDAGGVARRRWSGGRRCRGTAARCRRARRRLASAPRPRRRSTTTPRLSLTHTCRPSPAIGAVGIVDQEDVVAAEVLPQLRQRGLEVGAEARRVGHRRDGDRTDHLAVGAQPAGGGDLLAQARCRGRRGAARKLPRRATSPLLTIIAGELRVARPAARARGRGPGRGCRRGWACGVASPCSPAAGRGTGCRSASRRRAAPASSFCSSATPASRARCCSRRGAPRHLVLQRHRPHAGAGRRLVAGLQHALRAAGLVDVHGAFEHRHARAAGAGVDGEDGAHHRDVAVAGGHPEVTAGRLLGGLDDDVAALELRAVVPPRRRTTEKRVRSRSSTVEPSASRTMALWPRGVTTCWP